jgi:recombinational DNA repair protein RecR
MTGKDFITYLGKKLLYSSVDCCSICANNPQKGYCKNCEGETPDDEVCIEGMREFAEKGEGQ